MRVLVIEANASNAQSIELMLKSQSFNVYTTDLGRGRHRILQKRIQLSPYKPSLHLGNQRTRLRHQFR